MTANAKPLCCPRCKGTSGYTCRLRETHSMFGDWGESPVSGGTHRDIKNPAYSHVRCIDCDASFRFSSLERKGLIP